MELEDVVAGPTEHDLAGLLEVEPYRGSLALTSGEDLPPIARRQLRPLRLLLPLAPSEDQCVVILQMEKQHSVRLAKGHLKHIPLLLDGHSVVALVHRHLDSIAALPAKESRNTDRIAGTGRSEVIGCLLDTPTADLARVRLLCPQPVHALPLREELAQLHIPIRTAIDDDDATGVAGLGVLAVRPIRALVARFLGNLTKRLAKSGHRAFGRRR
mmetsp:Transcript_65758/g.145613  ORF Transcript_65758/g.145613 Transcript_65758/m.145613 type:complete len:214 (+) Transcript_65758:170-811(+)